MLHNSSDIKDAIFCLVGPTQQLRSYSDGTSEAWNQTRDPCIARPVAKPVFILSGFYKIGISPRYDWCLKEESETLVLINSP